MNNQDLDNVIEDDDETLEKRKSMKDQMKQ